MFPAFEKSYFSLEDIENGLKKCDCIKYAAYRTAAKLLLLQKAFHFDKVQLKVVSSVFERHHLQQTENSVQLHKREVESVLSDIYFAVKKANDVWLDVDYLSQLLFNFLLNVFDRKKTHMIQVFTCKVGLTLLCETKPREKYHYLFEQLADHNNCLSRKKLEILLKKMIRLTEYLGEGLSFGLELIPGTVESCFQHNIGSLGLSIDIFMGWLMQDPQLLVWLSTMYRMQISEPVSHNAKCEICKVFPLTGLRYRCLRCLSYDMCQSCFFTGKINKKHKLKHPVQEYCCPMTSQQSTKAFLLTLKNRLCKKDCKLQYLPALRVDPQESEPSDTCSSSGSTRLLDEVEISSRTLVNGFRFSSNRFPHKELQSIIIQLEKESEKIIPQVDNFCRCAQSHELNECRTELKNCLMKHSAQVRAQVQRLKLLRNYLVANGKLNFFASTPVVDENLTKWQKRNLRADLANVSPIALRTGKREEMDCQKNMMWDNYEFGTCRKTSWEELESGSRGSVLSEVSEEGEKSASASEAEGWKDGDSEFQLSTLLGGKTLRELDTTLGRGVTWLGSRKSDEEKIREENEETPEELQDDLKRILNKLQDLSVGGGGRGESPKGEVEYSKNTDGRSTVDVDALLLDLINGIEKLMDN